MEDNSDSGVDIEEQIEEIERRIDQHQEDVDKLAERWDMLKVKRTEILALYRAEIIFPLQVKYLLQVVMLDCSMLITRQILRIVMTQVKYLMEKLKALCGEFKPNSLYSLYKF